MSPSSANAEPVPACRIPVKRAAMAQAHGPGVTLPLRFILAGFVALGVAVTVLVLRPEVLSTYHYHQHVLAVTHLVVLGWILSVVMGVLYEMVPVVAERRLHSERLAAWHFPLHLVGVVGMTAMFWVWDPRWMGLFGVLVTLGIVALVYNLLRTLPSLRTWNVVIFALASALGWLVVTVLAGLFLAASKTWAISPFTPMAAMHAHAHAGVAGVFVMLIVGVSYRLVPMFAITEVQSRRRAWASLVLLHAGLLLGCAGILLEEPWKIVGTMVTCAGLACYGWELRAMLKARQRRFLGWTLRTFVAGVGLLLPVSGLALVLSWPGLPLNEWTGRLENLYGFSALMGVVSLCLLGMAHKIVPFLVWYRSYGSWIGRAEVPSLKAMQVKSLQVAGFVCYLAGFIGCSAATMLGDAGMVRWAGMGLMAGVGLTGANLAVTVRHWLWPVRGPLVAETVGPASCGSGT